MLTVASFFEMKLGYDCYGSDIRSSTLVSAEECIMECLSMAQCKAVQYSPITSTSWDEQRNDYGQDLICYLKTGCSNLIAKERSVSYVMHQGRQYEHYICINCKVTSCLL